MQFSIRYLFVLVIALIGCTSSINLKLIDAAGDGDVLLIQDLLAKGADVNAYGRDDQTPLIAAVWNGKLDAVKVLLDGGADPNLPTGDVVPLFIAFDIGRADIAYELLSRGGKLVVPDVLKDRFVESVEPRIRDDKEFRDLLERAGYSL